MSGSKAKQLRRIAVQGRMNPAEWRRFKAIYSSTGKCGPDEVTQAFVETKAYAGRLS